MDVSAVCQYQIADVKKVFEGSYKEYREAAQRWGRYTGAVPVPRPGAVRVEVRVTAGGERGGSARVGTAGKAKDVMIHVQRKGRAVSELKERGSHLRAK